MCIATCAAKVRTPEGLLKTWRKATRQYPFDFHVGPHRIVHARNVLVSGASFSVCGQTEPSSMHNAIEALQGRFSL